MKTYKLDLTDAEWVRLIDGDCEDSALPKCCANISELRSTLISICRDGRNGEVMEYKIDRLKQHLKWVEDGHDLADMPVIKKIMQQIGYDSAGMEHEKQEVERESL